MELKNYFAQDQSGNVIASPVAYLYLPGTTTLAIGLQDATGATLANPLTGTSQGQVQVAAPDGDYDLRVTGAGRDFTIRVRFTSIRGGMLWSGAWVKLPGVYKLLLGGAGTVTIDTRDRSGTVTSGAATYTAAGLSENYPYFSGAYELRATLTGTATAEIV